MAYDRIYYKVKAICTNCGAGQEYQAPKGVKLHLIDCVNCGSRTLRLATQDEAKNIPALTFTKHKIICSNCNHISILETPSYEDITTLVSLLGRIAPCESCSKFAKRSEVID